MPVVDVGTGVGYFKKASPCEGEDRAWRFEGRGKAGEDESGSNAGSREGAGRLTPAVVGNEGCILTLLGDESIMADVHQLLQC